MLRDPHHRERVGLLVLPQPSSAMISEAISKYFDATEHRKVREDLVFAASEVREPKIAIDCGCGAGADINYLVNAGYRVFGFDIEKESIARCESRFAGNDDVVLSQSSFSAFDYPPASLVVADASLFFCPPSDFENVWKKIFRCLHSNGVFCGSFLGVDDTMAQPGENPTVLWSEVSVFEECEVRQLFKDFEVLRFNVHRSSGLNSHGIEHRWHIIQVVARKLKS